MPEVIAINLHGTPRAGVGPQDVAIAIIGRVFDCGFVKNKIMEFVGDGISKLPIEFRNGIDDNDYRNCMSFVSLDDGRRNAQISHRTRT